MKYLDKVYGESEINEPVILELIDSGAFQRLKGISQAGYFTPFSPAGRATVTRFEHSLGVFLLLKKYGARIEEQIAGLIHDVSHSVFSHCIDYVLAGASGKEQDHQDNIFANFVKNSDILPILEKYNFDLDYILDSLGVKDNKWVFRDFQSGKYFAELFSMVNERYYTGQPTATMFITVGDCLKYALNNNYISQDDLYKTDEVVLDKIKSNLENDEKLNQLFLRMNHKSPFTAKIDSKGQVFCKSRAIDPLVFDNGKIKRVSKIDPEWGERVKREMKPKQYLVEFIEN